MFGFYNALITRIGACLMKFYFDFEPVGLLTVKPFYNQVLVPLIFLNVEKWMETSVKVLIA